MKPRFPIHLLFASLVATTAARSAIVVGGPVPRAIPQDFEGVYFNPFTGAASGSHPGTWATAPWINPFFGGVYIGTNGLLLPAITGSDQILNLPVGILIGGDGMSFAEDQSGSTTHLGEGIGNFVLDVPGYIGFAMQSEPSAPTQYGWLEIEIHNTGPGSILAWAYEDTPGTPIQAGAVPEPAATLLTLTGLVGLMLKKRDGQGVAC